MTTTTTAQLRAVLPPGTWTVDPAHSSVGFSVKHMGIATVRGHFNEFEGELRVDESGGLTATGSIDAASIDTRSEQRDEHLRSPDFFDAENHPRLTFRATEVEPLDEDTFTVIGELTIRDVTGRVELTATVEGSDIDPWGNERVAITATGSLRRSDYGLTWNQALGSGNMLVGEKVSLAIDVSAIKSA